MSEETNNERQDVYYSEEETHTNPMLALKVSPDSELKEFLV